MSACARRLFVLWVRGGVCIGPRWDDLVFKAVCQPDGTWHVFLRLTAGVLGPFLVVGGLILDSFSLSLLFIACFMQVGDNNLGGALWMVSGLGALELKRNHNPLGIDVLIMLDEVHSGGLVTQDARVPLPDVFLCLAPLGDEIVWSR